MKSILYVGMDVHTSNYTLCCYSIEKDEIFATVQMPPELKSILKYLNQIKSNHAECDLLCGYEAGVLGYTLHRQLFAHGIDCVILAPSTMVNTSNRNVKTDKRDAANIARNLAYRTYSPVYIPTEEDNAVKEYIRMRDDAREALKTLKRQILSFCTRNNKYFTEGRSYWTLKHIAWLDKLEFDNKLLQETFDESLISYRQGADKVARLDRRIEELAYTDSYEDRVRKLICLIGIKAHTALATIVEIGDFQRFAKAEQFASYLGLVPGEDSSGTSIRRTGITKAGNSHVRRLLIEAAQCYGRGAVGAKPKTLSIRQAGNDPKVIAYADRANERLRRKCYKIMFRSKRNIAVTAVARELACFIWGMMTENFDRVNTVS